MKGMINTISEFMQKIKDDHVTAYAAQAAYFIILSFIPFMLLLMTSVRYFNVDRQEVIKAVTQVCPKSFTGFIENIVYEVYDKSMSVVPLSAIVALWSAGKGIQSLTNGFNCIYGVKETRNFFISRIRSIFYILLFVISIIMTLILQVFGITLQKKLTKYLPFLERMLSSIINMRILITLSTLGFIFLFLYKFIPNRKATFQSQMPGAIFSAVSWSGFSYGFSLYFQYYNGAYKMYGSMTTIILLMLWMYFCMIIMMIGAQINCYFEEKIRMVQQKAAEAIRKEYYFLLGKEDETEEEEES